MECTCGEDSEAKHVVSIDCEWQGMFIEEVVVELPGCAEYQFYTSNPEGVERRLNAKLGRDTMYQHALHLYHISCDTDEEREQEIVKENFQDAVAPLVESYLKQMALLQQENIVELFP